MGLFVAAGFVMALSQLLGGWTKGGFPKISPNVFLFGFVPVLVTAGWVMLFSQPPNTVQQHVSSWSQDIGVRDVVQNLREYVGILAFGLGLVFGYTFDTSGPRRTTAVVERDREVVREPVARPEDEPTLRDRRETTDTPRVAGRGFLGRRRNAEPTPTVSDGTPVDETTVGPTTRR
jgi:hypothetical protein